MLSTARVYFCLTLVLTNLLALTGCGYSDKLHVRHGMLKLLWVEQYAELDQALDEQYRLYDKGELKAADFVAQLVTLRMTDANFRPRYEAWVARRPDSRWASLLQGMYFLEGAWKVRGQDVAANTPSGQLAAMRQEAELAVKSLRRAADAGVSPALYGGALIGAGMLLGDSAGSEEIVGDALRADPKIWMAATAYFQLLYPQWGGSEAAMGRFVDEIRSQNPQLATRLDADMLWRQGMDYETSGQMVQAMRRYESAIAVYPHFYALQNLGAIYVRVGRCKEAGQVLETNLKQNDEWDLWTIEMLHQAQKCNGDHIRAWFTLRKRDELLMRYRQGI